jgi:hypothetical protein
MQRHAQTGFKEEKICIGKTRNQIWRKYMLKRLQREITIYYPYRIFSCSSACFSLPSSCALISITLQRTQHYEFELHRMSEFPILSRTPILLAYRTLSAPAS